MPSLRRAWYLRHLSSGLLDALRQASDFPLTLPQKLAQPAADQPTSAYRHLLSRPLDDDLQLDLLQSDLEYRLTDNELRTHFQSADPPSSESLRLLVRELGSNVVQHGGAPPRGAAIALGVLEPSRRMAVPQSPFEGPQGLSPISTIELLFYDIGRGICEDLLESHRASHGGHTGNTEEVLQWAFTPAASRKSEEQRKAELAKAFADLHLSPSRLPPTGLFFVLEQCRQLKARLQVFSDGFRVAIDCLLDGPGATLSRAKAIDSRATLAHGVRIPGCAVLVSIPLLSQEQKTRVEERALYAALDDSPGHSALPAVPHAVHSGTPAQHLAEDVLALRRNLSTVSAKVESRSFASYFVPLSLSRDDQLLFAFLQALTVHQTARLRILALLPISSEKLGRLVQASPLPTNVLPLFCFTTDRRALLALPGNTTLVPLDDSEAPPLPLASQPISMPPPEAAAYFRLNRADSRYELIRSRESLCAEWERLTRTALASALTSPPVLEDCGSLYLLPSGVFSEVLFDLRHLAANADLSRLMGHWLGLVVERRRPTHLILVGQVAADLIRSARLEVDLVLLAEPDRTDGIEKLCAPLTGDVLILTDVVATGETLRGVRQALRNAGAVTWAAVVANEKALHEEAGGIALWSQPLVLHERLPENRGGAPAAAIVEIDAVTHTPTEALTLPPALFLDEPFDAALAPPGAVGAVHRQGPRNHLTLHVNVAELIELLRSKASDWLSRMRNGKGPRRWDYVFYYKDSLAAAAIAEVALGDDAARRLVALDRRTLHRRISERSLRTGGREGGTYLLVDDVLATGYSILALAGC